MRTRFDYSHINIILPNNLISGVWAESNEQLADGYVQECRESKEMEINETCVKTLHKVYKTWKTQSKTIKEVHVWSTNNNKTQRK